MKLIQNYLDANDEDVLQNDNFIFQSLPYYFKEQVKLGSFAHIASTHIQKENRDGIYSVFFGVMGERWYKGDTSQGRFVHDEVIIS